MRTALVILIGVHGIIHLFGFLKAFGWYQFNAINQPIPKATGVFWLLVFLLFTLTLILYSSKHDLWWVSGFLAVTGSQVLIFSYWSDAKFGSIANLLILLACILAYSSYHFQKKVRQERIALTGKSENNKQQPVTEASLSKVPPVVRKWLRQSGTVGKPEVSAVYLTQELQMKLKPEQEAWQSGRAEQYFTVQPPGFNWSVTLEMNKILRVTGRDKFVDGNGEMTIKLFSLIPVAHAADNEKTDRATAQRYLAEIVWFPSGALSKAIEWEEVNERAARATLEYRGTKGTGVFYFDESGNFQEFRTMRYMDAKDQEPTEWRVRATRTGVLNGMKIPVECEASWKLPEGDWTWLKLKVTHLTYDLDKMPVTNRDARP